jgi:two-component system LytT family response regulator
VRLRKHVDVAVVGECRNVREALKAVQELQPDVVFLDIQMPGRTGFEFLEKLEASPMPRIVFVTAHDEHAIRAFQVNALDYLLKPIDDERLDDALRRVRQSMVERERGSQEARLSALIQALDTRLAGAPPPPAGDDELAVRSNGRIRLIKIAEIEWVQAAGDYVSIYHNKRSVLMHATISSLEQKLKERGFLRIHRSALVNRSRIAELRALDNGEYDVLMQDGTQLKLSRNYRAALQEILAGKSL